jgi:hypothetical protein
MKKGWRSVLRGAQSSSVTQRAAARDRRAIPSRAVETPVQTHAELKAARWQRWLDDTRDFTAHFLGDPPPGRSALDRMNAT